MRRLTLLLILGATLAGATLMPDLRPTEITDDLTQAIFNANPDMAGPGTNSPAPGVSLADALTLERRASLWWDYARDVASVTSRLSNKGYTTLLVPVDKAVMAMPHKPHQNPSGAPASESEAAANVEAFIGAHIVPGHLTVGEDAQTLNKAVRVRLDDDKTVHVRLDGDEAPADIKVVGEKEARNGRILYIDHVVPY